MSVIKNENGKWCRNCPKCNKLIEYRHKNYAFSQEEKNRWCQSCFLKTQIEHIAEMKRKNRVELVCFNCKSTFKVPNCQKDRKYCSSKCKVESIRKNGSPIKGTGMGKEQREMLNKYTKYKRIDYIKGFVFDYTLEELRSAFASGECVYCGRKEWLGLDRIDNTKGHTKQNTVIACELCNMTRGNRFSIEEMKAIGKTIKSLNIKEKRGASQTSNNFWKKQKSYEEMLDDNKYKQNNNCGDKPEDAKQAHNLCLKAMSGATPLSATKIKENEFFG